MMLYKKKSCKSDDNLGKTDRVEFVSGINWTVGIWFGWYLIGQESIRVGIDGVGINWGRFDSVEKYFG